MSQEDGFGELLQYQLKTLQEKTIHNDWKKYLQKSLDMQESEYNSNNTNVIDIERELQELKQLKQQISESQKNANTLSEASHDLKSKCDLLRLENARLSEEIKKKTDEFDKEKVQLDAQKKQISEKSIIINASSELYEKILGLELRVLNGNRMQFIFKSADKPDCFVIISLNDKLYGITESYPELDNVKSIENALNKTNNLAGFVQYCRSALRKKLENLP